MRTLTLALIGAAALTAGLLIVRAPRPQDEDTTPRTKATPTDETVPFSLDRIRALGY